MSTKYNKYARQLEASFLKSREEYKTAADALEKAEKAKADADAWHSEKYIGERAVKQAKAEAAFLEAKANFDAVSRSAWADFDREKSRLTDELRAVIAADSAVNPDAVDAATVELLKSGVCRAADFAALVSRFDGNPTMTRLIAKYAADAAQTVADDAERAALNVLCQNVKSADNAIEQAWDSLLYSANICTGQSHGRGDMRYTRAMNNRWEQLVGAAVEGF